MPYRLQFSKLRLPLLGFFLALTALSGSAFAQNSGVIKGTVFVTDPNGTQSVLPGAKVTLQCKSTGSLVRTSTTDATGNYVFLGLNNDQCEVTASAPGFDMATLPAASRIGLAMELPFQLKVSTVQQSVSVTAEAQGIDVSETSVRSEISGKTMENTPSANDNLTDSLPLVPGVVRGPSGQLNIKGAHASESGLLVNSANVTDPVTGEYGFNLPVEVIQSATVLTNPYDAAYGRFTGAVTTVDTRSGQDKFKFQLQNFFPRARYRAGAVVGLASVTPRAILSGPIKKGKAYFVQSFEYRFNRTRVKGLKHLDESLQSDTNLESFDSHTQLDWDINASNHVRFALSLFPEKMEFVNLNTFNPQGVTPDYRQRGFLIGVSERKIFGDQSVLESFFSIKKFDVDVFPADRLATVMFLRPEENGGGFFNNQKRRSWRSEWQEIYNVKPLNAFGSHILRVGVDVSYATFSGAQRSNPVLIQNSAQTLLRRIDFSGNTDLGINSTEFTFFLQDKWNPLPRVTIDLGARYDRDELGENNNVSPRAGFAISLTKDNKTVLRGGSGLFFDKIPLNAAVFTQLQQRTITTFAPDGVTPAAAPERFTNVIANNHLDNPQSVAWDVELNREVSANLLVKVGYQQRQSRRQFIVDPISGANPELVLSNNGRSLYREYQAMARYTVPKYGQLFVSYTRSRSTGSLNEVNQFFGNFEDPVIQPNERSLQPFDATNRMIAWGTFELPKGFIFSPVWDVHTGFPFSLRNASREFIGQRNRAGRFPTFSSFDVQLTKRLKIPILRKHGEIGMRVFNVFDHFNPRDLQNISGSQPVTFRNECSQFGAFCNSVGRTFRGKFVVNF